MTHDEITGNAILSKAELKDGCYYVGRCRNASVARWNASEEVFYHWREKFGRIYIQTIKHPDDDPVGDGPKFDVFFPIREHETPKFIIPSQEAATYDGDYQYL